MPRANRLGGEGGVFHLTHRCHNRAFLLKFARDRDAYRALLREHLQKFEVSILDYCLTSNHVHLLVDVEERSQLSRFMQEVASEFARTYNRRKRRINAFWGDNYHTTLVDSGPYLWDCLCYIELNMVRCGVVAHPREWPWVGYHEIMGQRRRYRVIDEERLCWRLRTADREEVRKNLPISLDQRIAEGRLKREPCWTESLAVGSAEFVKGIRNQISSRVEMEIVETVGGGWVLQESPVPYGAKAGKEGGSKAA